MNPESFTKLFSSIITSSIWSEDDKTRIMWITMLACADADGFCSASIVGLAAMARMKLEDAEIAVAKLEAPDPHSRTPDCEGRRIAKVDGGWMLLNYLRYRARMNADTRREQTRLRVQRFRSKNSDVTQCNVSPSASASSSSGMGDSKGGKPTRAYAAAYAAEIDFPGWESWYDHFESNGWKVSGKTPMKDWKAAMRNGKRMAFNAPRRKKESFI